MMRRTGSIVAAGLACAAAIVAIVAIGLRHLSADGGPQTSHAIANCERSTSDGRSVARLWNEALLAAIRLDVPAPTVHARTLFHTSAAMWDAWAAYDEVAEGVFVDETHTAADRLAAREEAISYAAYGVLVERYLLSPGAEEAVTGFDRLMDDLCFDRLFTGDEGDSPAELGNRIAHTILAATLDDGSNEAAGYIDPSYEPVNPPLVVASSGTVMNDPNRWQPLELERMVAQNGMPLDETVQTFVGSHWGDVSPFALARRSGQGLPLDPGAPPKLGDPASDQEFKDAAVAVVAASAALDPGSSESIDISPASLGEAPLGTNDSRGHELNPATGAPYQPNVVALGDYGRVVAEFWADGPSSETPPGHWNAIANTVTDSLAGQFRIGGSSAAIDALEWDVKLYLSLNGAMHDAAIAAWGSKGRYDYTRPISMIRFMGGLGQSSDPEGPSFHPDGLPLQTGLVEVVTTASAAPGQRHESLSEHVGEVAVRSWVGAPDDPETGAAGVDWILAVDWVPYQRPTFVTPAFAGYVSGHSTFSRAAAEVLSAITGDRFFPGGLATWTIPAGSLEFEHGPTEDITLQWATYADAADEAGGSRIYGGIHVRADDLRGRELGYQVGTGAWALAEQYFDGIVDRRLRE
ncbi:MAG: vanadium-dependent haloperoxidase [Acidimicrobiales bacterium]